MNKIQLCGTVAGRPAPSYDGTAIWFNLRARHPPVIPGLPPGIAHVSCRVFRASPERREILLRRKHRNVRVAAAGRLEQIVSKGSGRWKNGRNNRRQDSNLERIVSQQGLRLRRGR
jgi:hypothetical protein